MPKADLLGEGTGGPSNIRLDPDLVWNSILTACREALAQAGLHESDLRRIHAGMGAAGAGQTSAVERLLSRAHPFASFEIETDAHTAWLGAFNGGDGAILIVGTGSCGYGGVERRLPLCRRLGLRDFRRGQRRRHRARIAAPLHLGP